MGPLTAAELARRAAVAREHVERLVDLGILVPADDGSFRPSDVRRVRLVDAFEAAGFSVETLVRAIAAGLRSLEAFDLGLPDPPGSSGRTLAELCDELGYDVELAAETFAALAVPVPAPDDELREDDAEAIATLLGIGDLRTLRIDENVAPRFAQIYGETVRRAIEASVRFWDDHVETRVAASDPAGELMSERIRLRGRLPQGFEATLLWLSRRHLEHEVLSVIVENTERAMERAGLVEARRGEPAIAFLDLTGSTRLTEEHGDEAAVELAYSLARLVEEVARRSRGRIVKHLGDGVMFHYAAPRDAVQAGLELVERAPGVGLPPARLGIDSGRVMFGDGDYFGRTVNVAARITDHAGPGEVLVSEAAAGGSGDDVLLESLGPVRLKGLREPVVLYRATRP